MYDFHYRYAVAKYGRNVKLLMTDTDSLMCSIQTSDSVSYTHLDVYKRQPYGDRPSHVDVFNRGESWSQKP